MKIFIYFIFLILGLLSACTHKTPGSPSTPTKNLADIILNASQTNNENANLLDSLRACQTECSSQDQEPAKTFLAFLESEGKSKINPAPACEYLLSNYANDVKYTYVLSMNCYNIALFIKPLDAEKSKELITKTRATIEQVLQTNTTNAELKSALTLIK